MNNFDVTDMDVGDTLVITTASDTHAYYEIQKVYGFDYVDVKGIKGTYGKHTHIRVGQFHALIKNTISNWKKRIQKSSCI